ncbi:DUF6090 family protein [Winogradskyella aquimaris]|uniref:DUF6090 family protein n=1 Tax=Winogradskyella aquimaris TaxID=864074 RepID=A0ABU5ENA9_9FLAO|nr:DUF6090 family protein [Winogradskyella aquimaris]MDY2587554.1 DUF6090 family protein [Winogradskyella aquimaris]
MIKFFRKIRQRLITENQFRKYLLYAIGEIVLVVIGILIALQINTWNQKRIAKEDERKILANLKSEFQQNRKELSGAITMNEKCMETGRFIMNLIGNDVEKIREIDTDSLLFQGFEYAQFNPSENALADLLQSGRLNLISDEYLKSLLYQWTRAKKGAEDQFSGLDDKIEDDLVPYLTLNYPLRDVDSYGRLAWKEKSKLDNDKTLIFRDMQYENLLDDFLYRLSGYTIELKRMDIIFKSIVAEIEKLEKNIQ